MTLVSFFESLFISSWLSTFTYSKHFKIIVVHSFHHQHGFCCCSHFSNSPETTSIVCFTFSKDLIKVLTKEVLASWWLSPGLLISAVTESISLTCCLLEWLSCCVSCVCVYESRLLAYHSAPNLEDQWSFFFPGPYSLTSLAWVVLSGVKSPAGIFLMDTRARKASQDAKVKSPGKL